MKAAALRYAQGDGPMPNVLILERYITRYGAQAVLHRDYIGAGEIMAINMAENIVAAYQGRAAAKSWAEWAQDNPELSALLARIELEVGDGN